MRKLNEHSAICSLFCSCRTRIWFFIYSWSRTRNFMRTYDTDSNDVLLSIWKRMKNTIMKIDQKTLEEIDYINEIAGELEHYAKDKKIKSPFPEMVGDLQQIHKSSCDVIDHIFYLFRDNIDEILDQMFISGTIGRQEYTKCVYEGIERVKKEIEEADKMFEE